MLGKDKMNTSYCDDYQHNNNRDLEDTGSNVRNVASISCVLSAAYYCQITGISMQDSICKIPMDCGKFHVTIHKITAVI